MGYLRNADQAIERKYDTHFLLNAATNPSSESGSSANACCRFIAGQWKRRDNSPSSGVGACGPRSGDIERLQSLQKVRGVRGERATLHHLAIVGLVIAAPGPYRKRLR